MTKHTYFLYIKLGDWTYKLVSPEKGSAGFSVKEACAAIDVMTESDHFAALVEYEPSGEYFYLGVPRQAMCNVTFITKPVFNASDASSVS